MKKTFLYILGITLACFILTTQPTTATVYDQFQQVTTRHFGLSPLGYLDFHLPPELQNKFVVLKDGYSSAGYNPADNQFRLYPNPATRPDNALMDGYAVVPLPFKYRYNGKDYHQVYVSINGFVTFEEPPGNAELARRSQWLFENSPGGGMPINVVAPYWGDHKYWQNDQAAVINRGWAPSEIGYVHGTYKARDFEGEEGDSVTRRFCLIQWKDLNVNWRDLPTTGIDTTYYRGNVTSFQLVIYEGNNDSTALQGDMEFRYNTLGPYTWQGNNAITRPNNRGSIGVKGSSIGLANKADYINALYNGFYAEFPANDFMQRNYDTLARGWPIVNVGRAILLVARNTILGDTVWGDGDADMSKAEGGRHRGMAQNRFVTLNDVRTIMRSVATQVPLDSLYKHAAFHADVDHNGRYYYLTNRNSGLVRIPRPDEPPDDNGNYRDDQYNTDTFLLRKVGQYAGGHGFNPYYGRNPNFMEIDFYDLGGIPISQSVKKVRILDPGNMLQDEFFDYQMRVAITNPADRALFWQASVVKEDDLRIERIRIRLKKSINWKDSVVTQNIADLPWISNAETQIFYEANERDASVILSYLGGRIPSLPWIYNNPNFNGKGKSTVPYQIATNIMFDNATVNSNDEIVIPVYFNGIAENSQSAVFNLNANIINLESANSDVFVDFSANRAVIVADGYFAPNTPIAYLTVENVAQIEATNVRFDGEDASDVSFKLNAENCSCTNNFILQNLPNPVINHTAFEVNIPETGNYSLVIYDLNGNVVKEIANGNFTAKTKYQFGWNATNANGEKVAEGTYIYRLIGENTNVSKKLIVVR